MVSLDNPTLVGAALLFAGTKRKHRKMTGGLDEMNLLAGGFGNSSADYIGQRVSNSIGGDTVTPLMGQALAGAVLSRWGDMIPENRAMAAGIHYNVISSALQQNGWTLGDFAGSVGNGGGNGGSQQMNSVPSAGAQTHMGQTQTAGGVRF